MTEEYIPWQGANYSADEWAALVIETLALAGGANVGVVPGFENELVVRSSGDNALDVATGRAISGAKRVYKNDIENNLTSNDPGGSGTTGRLVVLRDNWSARTTLLDIITSDDDDTTIPTPTQQDGVTWEIPLASFQIDPDGVITELTDVREFTEGRQYSGGRMLARTGTRYSIPGWWYSVSANGSFSTLADRLVFCLIQVHKRMTFDRIAIRLTGNAGASEKLRMGIYAADDNDDGLTPGALILDAGNVAIDAGATSTKEKTIDQTLAPGYYFLAYVHDATAGSAAGVLSTSAFWGPVSGQDTIPGSNHTGPLLITDADAGADWPNNGLPDPAPAVTGHTTIIFMIQHLRDSS